MRTIKSGREISTIFTDGRRYNTPYITILVSRNANQHDREGRVAFIAGKKLGGAVWRNRAKRRLRGVCYEVGGPFPGWDVVLIARKGIENASFDDMKSQLTRALNKARIVNG